MNKARLNELPPMVRRQVETYHSFIRSAKVMGDKQDAAKYRAELWGYVHGLADAGLITEAEAGFLCREG